MLKHAAVFSGLLGCAVLAACTSAGVSPRQTAGSVPEPAAASPPPLPATRASQFDCTPGKEWWRAAGAPKRGGIFTFGSKASRIDNLDPTAPGNPAALAHVYETLLQKRGCWDDDTAIAPMLAKSWEVSADGLTWTLKLRDDVKWHNLPPVNGRKFTSADAKWSIAWHQEHGIAGSFWRDVTVDTPDDYTVVLHRQAPNVDFAEIIAVQTNVMLPHEIADQYGDFKSMAVGTGAFQHKEWRDTDYSWEERNPDFRETGADGKRLPYLDGYKEVVFSDYSAELAAFRSRQLDRTRTIGIKHQDAVALEQTVPGTRRTVQWVAGFSFLSFKLDKKPWNDVRVRQAISLAINRVDLVESNQGVAVWATFIPQVFSEYAWSQEQTEQKFKQDQARARQLLADAGYPPGSIQASIVTPTAYQQDAEVVQQQLKAVGIETTIDSEGQNFQAVFQKRQYPDLAYGQRGGNYWPGYWAYDWVHSRSTQNFLGFADDQVDQLALAQLKEQDQGKRKQIMDREQDRLYELMPFVPTVTRNFEHAWACRIKNLPPHSYGWPGIDVAWIDETGC